MGPSRVLITEGIVSAMRERAIMAAPMECCGLLSGNGSLISRSYPLRNTADHPETRYFAAPDDLLAAMRSIRSRGELMMGIYHSHPKTPAYPSASDVRMAFYPDAVYFILSLTPAVDIRAFTIVEGKVSAAEFRIEKEITETQPCLEATR